MVSRDHSKRTSPKVQSCFAPAGEKVSSLGCVEHVFRYTRSVGSSCPETDISTQGENPLSSNATRDAQAPVRLDGLQVLVVDDSPDNQILFERVLTMAGARVDIAENGAIALTRASGARYDVVIMDMRMPVMDGYEATKRLRATGFTNPIIALTAHSNPGEEAVCRGAGCSAFFLKPINRASLLNAVSNAVRENKTKTN